MCDTGGYRSFAEFYDRLTSNVDYAEQAQFIMSLFMRHGEKHPDTLLDLACGSGSLSLEFAKRGVDMIGVDASAEMLIMAREKAAALDSGLLFLQQDMRELDLYGTVDGAVCTLDSINHLCETQDVAEVFRRLSLFVGPRGLFIFDVNTAYKHKNVLSDNAFVFEKDDFVCTWQNHFMERRCEVDMQLDFFVNNGDSYDRLTDYVRERAYSERTLRRLLQDASFEVVAVYDDYSDNLPTPQTERLVFVTRSTRDFSDT